MNIPDRLRNVAEVCRSGNMDDVRLVGSDKKAVTAPKMLLSIVSSTLEAALKDQDQCLVQDDLVTVLVPDLTSQQIGGCLEDLYKLMAQVRWFKA